MRFSSRVSGNPRFSAHVYKWGPKKLIGVFEDIEPGGSGGSGGRLVGESEPRGEFLASSLEGDQPDPSTPSGQRMLGVLRTIHLPFLFSLWWPHAHRAQWPSILPPSSGRRVRPLPSDANPGRGLDIGLLLGEFNQPPVRSIWASPGPSGPMLSFPAASLRVCFLGPLPSPLTLVRLLSSSQNLGLLVSPVVQPLSACSFLQGFRGRNRSVCKHRPRPGPADTPRAPHALHQ